MTHWCKLGLHTRDLVHGHCLECEAGPATAFTERRELEEHEPPVYSIVMSEGPLGLAWQRHASDGLWHATSAREPVTWKYLVKRWRPGSPLRIVYMPDSNTLESRR